MRYFGLVSKKTVYPVWAECVLTDEVHNNRLKLQCNIMCLTNYEDMEDYTYILLTLN